LEYRVALLLQLGDLRAHQIQAVEHAVDLGVGVPGRLSKFAKNVVVLRGGMGAKRSRAASETLGAISDGDVSVCLSRPAVISVKASMMQGLTRCF
jgi:hypothetical protein